MSRRWATDGSSRRGRVEARSDGGDMIAGRAASKEKGGKCAQGRGRDDAARGGRARIL